MYKSDTQHQKDEHSSMTFISCVTTHNSPKNQPFSQLLWPVFTSFACLRLPGGWSKLYSNKAKHVQIVHHLRRCIRSATEKFGKENKHQKTQIYATLTKPRKVQISSSQQCDIRMWNAQHKRQRRDLQRAAHCGTQSTCQNLFSETTEQHNTYMHNKQRLWLHAVA